MAKDDINKEGLRDKHEFTDKSGESQSTEQTQQLNMSTAKEISETALRNNEYN